MTYREMLAVLGAIFAFIAATIWWYLGIVWGICAAVAFAFILAFTWAWVEKMVQEIEAGFRSH